MRFEVEREDNPVEEFLVSAPVDYVRDMVLARASWGSDPISDTIEVLLELCRHGTSK